MCSSICHTKVFYLSMSLWYVSVSCIFDVGSDELMSFSGYCYSYMNLETGSQMSIGFNRTTGVLDEVRCIYWFNVVDVVSLRHTCKMILFMLCLKTFLAENSKSKTLCGITQELYIWFRY